MADRDWIEKTISRHDRDGDGGISLEEFFNMQKNRAASASSTGPAAVAGAATTGADKGSGGSSSSSLSSAAQTAALLEKAKLAFNAYDRNRYIQC